MQGSIVPSISYSTVTGIVAVQGSGNEVLPEFGRTNLDFVNDGSVHPIGPTGLTPRMSMTAGTAFGNESDYFQAGVLRGSFGPFWGENAVLSSSSPQAGHFSLTLQQGTYTVTMALLEIAGTDNNGGGSVPDKFLALNGLELYPTDWLTLGIYEAVVWGPRFEPLYLLPVISFYAQGMAGYQDNSFIGISGGVKFPHAVKADFLLYIDDASFNDLARLHFNTMLVLSFQTGVSWTPNLPFLTRLSANVLLVTPYTYSHTDDNGDVPGNANYLNYTNQGQNIGPSIQPDSARFEVNALLRPVTYLDLNVFGRLTLHGNGSAGIPGGGDGTIFDDGYVGGKPTYAPGYALPAGFVYTRFLTQSVLEKSLQTGIDAKINLDTPAGHVQVDLGYTLQYVLNVNLTASNALNNYLSLGVVYTY